MAAFAGMTREKNEKAGSDPGLFSIILLSSSANGSAEWPPDDRLRRTIQYAAPFRFYRWRLRLLDARLRGHDEVESFCHAHYLPLRSGNIGSFAAADAGAQRAAGLAPLDARKSPFRNPRT
jgi:hypothetical protein